MEWLVKISGKEHQVALPERINSNEIFSLVLNQKKYEARWKRETKTLFVRSQANSAWRSIELRNHVIQKVQDDDDSQVYLEYFSPQSSHPISLEGSVGLFVPGSQESKLKKQREKNLTVRSQITGKVIKILVKPGDDVKAGETLLIIEAMKMENRITALSGGTIDAIKVQELSSVTVGQELVKFKPAQN